MPKRRDDFSESTKRTLAGRVAWRCSFPSCPSPTIGPSAGDLTKTVVLGEAAHITAAASGGARFDASLSTKERKAIANGVWMCRPHARLVDADEANFSAVTLRQWKTLAERRAYEAMEAGMAPASLQLPTTLVALGLQVVFQGVWVAGGASEWEFECQRFLVGGVETLRDFVEHDSRSDADAFVVVESQGDGRALVGQPHWKMVDGCLRIFVPVRPRVAPTNPDAIGVDLALDATGDLQIGADGDLKLVSGEQNAVQKLSIAASTRRGEMSLHPTYGSLCSRYYRLFRNDSKLLARLFSLELARMATIPLSLSEPEHHPPSLDFVWRIEGINIPSTDLGENRRLGVEVSLIWSNRKHWTGVVPIYIHDEDADLR